MDASVEAVGTRFWPAAIQVNAGTTVTWTFGGDAPHTVTSVPATGVTFDSGGRVNGEFTFTFDAPGTYWYYCKIHPGMVGKVVVER